MLPPAVVVVWYVEEPTKVERVARGLVDVLEPVGAEVDAAEVACHDHEDVFDLLDGENTASA